MKKICVIVTGTGGGGHGEQIVKALRLGKWPYRIVGTDTTSLSSGQTLVDDFATLPPASAPDYIDRLIDLAKLHNASAVFHGSEPEMRALAMAKERLSQEKIYVPVNPLSVIDICSDKAKTMRFLEKQDILVPRTLEVSTLKDLDGYDKLPAVIKPSVGGGGSANVFIAQNRDELLAFATYLLSLYPRFIVQEYVGTPEDEFTVGVLFGADGEFLNSIGIKRIMGTALTTRIKVANRSGRTELGRTLVVSSGISQGIVGRWPEVTAQCEVIARALQPTAPVNVQCRFVDGRVIPFEINPRFSGTTSIRAMAGYNEPDVLLRREILGEAIVTRFAYREIVIMRSLCEYEIAPGH